MIFYVLILYVAYLLIKKDVREKLFITTIVTTIFLYSSCDPFFKMPLYFEIMLFSILVTIVNRGSIKISKNVVIILCMIMFFLIIQMLNLETGHNITQVLLLKLSDTDVMDISSELMTPTLDFTVIKHFVFYTCYLIFILVNKDILRDKNCIDRLFEIVIKVFKALFVCLIVESLVVNLLGGYNDRSLMQFLFGFKRLNMNANWKTFGIYSVAFCFTERSYMGVVVVYYLIQSVYKKYDGDFLKWLVISIVAVICTGSSTALTVVLLFLVYFLGDVFIKGKSVSAKLWLILVLIISGIMFFKYSSSLLSKITIFFNTSEIWSSGYFRKQSIIYGLQAIRFSPFVGIGIGTVYAHSMLIQTIANIGFVGVILAIAYHMSIMGNRKMNTDKFFKAIITIAICSSTFTVQEFTSPLLLCLLLGCLEDTMSEEVTYKSRSCLQM